MGSLSSYYIKSYILHMNPPTSKSLTWDINTRSSGCNALAFYVFFLLLYCLLLYLDHSGAAFGAVPE